jgi:hypothetical protein
VPILEQRRGWVPAWIGWVVLVRRIAKGRINSAEPVLPAFSLLFLSQLRFQLNWSGNGIDSKIAAQRDDFIEDLTGCLVRPLKPLPAAPAADCVDGVSSALIRFAANRFRVSRNCGNDHRRIDDDIAYAPNLAPGQLTTTYMFVLVTSNKLSEMKRATFRIVEVSKY